MYDKHLHYLANSNVFWQFSLAGNERNFRILSETPYIFLLISIQNDIFGTMTSLLSYFDRLSIFIFDSYLFI